ncbi:MAG TPA: hypothetical protein ENO22_08760 [candidate division Zixibacteria bacterium]|nr:hypothetical protein [candidate division Zixibacteria bacterium]
MHKFFTSIIIILLLCYTSGLTAQSMYSFEPNTLEKEPEIALEPKSKSWGLFHSLVPGLALHGCGLLYAEEFGRAAITMGVEALSLYLICYAVENNEIRHGCTTYYDMNAAAYGLLGIGLFSTTWIYDVVMTQKSIHEHNEFIKHRGFSLDIGTLENSDGPTLTFGFSWRF